MIQQVTIFLPGCSLGFWIKLKIDGLVFKQEGELSFLTDLIQNQVLRNPSAIYTYTPRCVWYFPTQRCLLILDKSKSESKGKWYLVG